MCVQLSAIPIPNFLAAPTCCVCGQALPAAVHVVLLEVAADWIPSWQGRAVAVVCPGCYGQPARRAVQVREGVVVYHAVEELETLVCAK